MKSLLTIIFSIIATMLILLMPPDVNIKGGDAEPVTREAHILASPVLGNPVAATTAWTTVVATPCSVSTAATSNIGTVCWSSSR